MSDAVHPPEAEHPKPAAAEKHPTSNEAGFWANHWGKAIMAIVAAAGVGYGAYQHSENSKGSAFLQAVNAPNKLPEGTELIPTIVLQGKMNINRADPAASNMFNGLKLKTTTAQTITDGPNDPVSITRRSGLSYMDDHLEMNLEFMIGTKTYVANVVQVDLVTGEFVAKAQFKPAHVTPIIR